MPADQANPETIRGVSTGIRQKLSDAQKCAETIGDKCLEMNGIMSRDGFLLQEGKNRRRLVKAAGNSTKILKSGLKIIEKHLGSMTQVVLDGLNEASLVDIDDEKNTYEAIKRVVLILDSTRKAIWKIEDKNEFFESETQLNETNLKYLMFALAPYVQNFTKIARATIELIEKHNRLMLETRTSIQEITD